LAPFFNGYQLSVTRGFWQF